MAVSDKQLIRYLHRTLGVQITPRQWKEASTLPLFLRDGYTFYEAVIVETPCLLMVDNEGGQTAATVRKHIEQVASKLPVGSGAKNKSKPIIVYVCETTTSDERLRLIEQKLPFIVPDKQMYLPMLGMDLREHYRKMREPVVRFSPATQATVILLLTESNPPPYDAVALAERLGYSKMTASRVMNELISTEIGVVETVGRARTLLFDGDRRGLWNRCLAFLDTPVRYRQMVKTPNKGSITGLHAGLTALASRSMLAKPLTPIIALTTDQWTEIRSRDDVKPTSVESEDALELEAWGYDPALFAVGGDCDTFSLFLSLRDETDERVLQAIEEMMEGIQW